MSFFPRPVVLTPVRCRRNLTSGNTSSPKVKVVSFYVVSLKVTEALGILTEDLAVEKNGQREAMELALKMEKGALSQGT